MGCDLLLPSDFSHTQAIFGGFLSNTAAMPRWISWLRYLSLFYYSFEVLVSNELDGIELDFRVEGFVNVRNIDGRTFLASLNQDPERIPMDIGCLFMLFLVLSAASGAVLVAGSARPVAARPSRLRLGTAAGLRAVWRALTSRTCFAGGCCRRRRRHHGQAAEGGGWARGASPAQQAV